MQYILSEDEYISLTSTFALAKADDTKAVNSLQAEIDVLKEYVEDVCLDDTRDCIELAKLLQKYFAERSK
jgi:hypothetical protein